MPKKIVFNTNFLLFALTLVASTFYTLLPNPQNGIDTIINQIKQEQEQFAQIPKDLKNKEYVKKKLAFMVYIDQKIRNFIDTSSQKFDNYFYKTWQEIDKQNTHDLKEILQIYNWLSISEFGKETDRNAWLIVQHADHDHPFQIKVVSILKQLIKKNETDIHNYAYLYDRVAINLGNKQQYGTQIKIEEDKIRLAPYEGTLENLNHRRNLIGLESIEKYLKKIENLHLKNKK